MRAIFISYRREDAEGQAGRLFADLVKHFGDQAVFMDVATIEPGRDFRKAIDEHVGSCGVLLSLIGKDWLDAKDAQGHRRLDDESDFVRLETASALKRDIPVVPVLVHGARMPRKEDLPADLQDLAFRNAIELTHARWDSDLTVLIKALSRFITPASAPAPVSTPERATPPSVAAPGAAPRSKLLIAGAALLVIVVGAFLFLRTPKEKAAAEPAITADATPSEPAAKEVQPEAQAEAPPASPPVATRRGAERNTLFGVADWDKDGHQDFVSRKNATADLWLYPGDGKRGPRQPGRIRIGNGWEGFTPFGMVDWDGDGNQDIITRNDTTAQLMLYPGQSQRGPSNEQPVEIGVGWNGLTFFGAADWDGDGHQDLVVRNDTSGDLTLYPGEGVRRMSNIQPVQIGVGWKGFTFVGMTDWDGDGHQDILTRNDTNGDLMLYPGEGVRRMSQTEPSRIGKGWKRYSFFGVGDWDRDGKPDILMRDDGSGDLLLHPGHGSRSLIRIHPVVIAATFDERQ